MKEIDNAIFDILLKIEMKQSQLESCLQLIRFDSNLSQIIQRQLFNDKCERKHPIIGNVEKMYRMLEMNVGMSLKGEGDDEGELQVVREIGRYIVENKNETIEVFESESWLSRALYVCVMKVLQRSRNRQSKIVEEVCGYLVEGIAGVQKILQDYSLFKLYLSLFYLKALEVLKGSQQLVFFHSYIYYLDLLEKYLKSYEEQFETIRTLFRIGTKLMTILHVQLHQRYTQSEESGKGGEIDRVQSYRQQFLSSQDLQKYYKTIVKYSYVDPQFRYALMKEVEEYFGNRLMYRDRIGQKYIVEIFRIVVDLMNKRIYEDLQKEILGVLSRISKKLNRENVSSFERIFKIFIANQSDSFLQRYENELLNFGVVGQLKRVLFSVYYLYMINTKNNDVGQRISNALICWNVELGIIDTEEFIQNIVPQGLLSMNAECYSVLIQGGSELCQILRQKLIESQYGNDRIEVIESVNQQLFTSDIRVYIQYTTEYIRYLTKIQPNQFRLSPSPSITLLKNMDILRKTHQNVIKIRSQAMKYQIYQQDLLYYFCLLCSVVQARRITELYQDKVVEYYVRCLRKIGKDRVMNFGRAIVQIYGVFKNGLGLFLILGCCLIGVGVGEEEENVERCREILGEVTNILQGSNFAIICGYGEEILKMLLLLSFSRDAGIQNLCNELISLFSILYRKTDVDLILYQFDPKIFEPLLGMLGVAFPTYIQNSGFITRTLEMTRKLVVSRSRSKSSSYSVRSDNCIHFIPIRHANHKNSLMMTFNALINPEICYNSTIEIYGSLKEQQSDVIQKHRIAFKNRKISFENRVIGEVIGYIDNFPDKIFSKSLLFSIQVIDSNLKILINDQKLIQMQYDYMLDCIRFDLNGDIMIKNLKWKKFQNSEKILQFDQAYQVFPSQAEIKIGRLQQHHMRCFREKLQVVDFCGYMLELLKNNYMGLDLNLVYGSCFELVYWLSGCDKSQYTANQQLHMRQLFKTILKFAQRKMRISLPGFFTHKPEYQLQGRKLYQILSCTVLDSGFILQGTDQLQLQIYTYLKQLFFSKKAGEFHQHFECMQTRVFSNLCKVFMQVDGVVQNKFGKLLKKLVVSHQANCYLVKKLYLMYSYANNSPSLYFVFNGCVLEIFNECLAKELVKHSQKQALKQSKSERGHQHIDSLRRYLIENQTDFSTIFMMVNQRVKIVILQYMINDCELSVRWHDIFKNLHENDIPELSSWIIVQCKKMMFEIFDCGRRTGDNLRNIVFLVRQMCRVYASLREENQQEECVAILCSFLAKSQHILKQNNKSQIAVDLQKLYCSSELIHVIESRIIGFSRDGEKQLQKEQLVCLYFQFLFLQMPKFVVLRALTEFRVHREYMKESLRIMLRLHCIREMFELKGCFLSVFLQYIIEVLIVLKNSEKNTQEIKQVAGQINEYIRKLFKYYPGVSTVKQPFFYAYPKLERERELNQKDQVKRLTQQARKAVLYQLRGGICFKIICLMFHLMKILPDVDFSDYLSLYLQVRENKAIERAMHDFIQVRKQAKSRSYIDEVITKCQSEHSQYFFNNDEEMNRGRVGGEEDDLTPFYVDFILMKMFIYLENHCVKGVSEGEIAILKVYSELTIKYLRNSENIWDEMTDKNTDSAIYYQEVGDLGYEQQTMTQNNNKQIIQQIIEQQYLTPQKPRRKQSGISSIQLKTTSKKKKQLFQKLQECIYRWSEQAKQKNLHQYFRDQAKQILFVELLHQIYVTSSEESRSKLATKMKRNQKFINDYQTLIEQDKLDRIEYSNFNDRIRLVYLYTCSSPPQTRLNYHSFPNGTFPFTTKYSIEQLKPVNQFLSEIPAENNLVITSLPLHLEEKTTTHTVVELFKTPEESQNICEVSNREGVYFCQWELNEKQGCIIFNTKNQKKAPNQKMERKIKFGSPCCNIIAGNGKKIRLKVRQIYEIFYRKYNQIRNNCIQIFMKNGISIYVVFYTAQLTDRFISQCRVRLQKFCQIRIISDHIKQFHNENYTEKWTRGQMNNFDYLMIINKYAARTCNDLNQYYVFPWIVMDYQSKGLDIGNGESFRNLKKPIGALNQKKLEKYKEKYREKYQKADGKYLYGSHYSTSLFLLYYLVRLQPFTNKQMQSGVFDGPDRLFSSLFQMWQCLMSESSTSDVKESIPQFYYFPIFLKNINKLELGTKTDGYEVNDVVLPVWASSMMNFIHKMRICLQSDQVSMNLNKWIDLIFGKDQSQQKKDNLFHPLSYVDKIQFQNLQQKQNLDAMMTQIAFFGQNPYVLFENEHPRKKMRSVGMGQSSDLYSSSRILKESVDLKQSREFRQSRFLMNVRDSGGMMVVKENLEMIRYVSQVRFKGRKIVEMTVSAISKNSSSVTFELDMEKKLQSLVRTIQQRDNNKVKKVLSLNNIDGYEEKPSVTYTIEQNEIVFSIGTSDVNEVVKSMRLSYSFTKVRFNETVLVVFGGGPGLRIYNWNQEVVWEYLCQSGEVSECFLEYGLIFFACSAGKVFIYDFFSQCIEMLYAYEKATYEVVMLVYPKNKCISKKNENEYKFLLVADKRKIVLMNYIHKVGKMMDENYDE